jgi:hypothetical protein
LFTFDLKKISGRGNKALVEKIEVLCQPGAKETGESHTGLGAFRTASSSTDLAGNDEWAHTEYRQIVRANPKYQTLSPPTNAQAWKRRNGAGRSIERSNQTMEQQSVERIHPLCKIVCLIQPSTTCPAKKCDCTSLYLPI